MTAYSYALFTTPNADPSTDADWFDTVDEALAAAREAIEGGADADDVEVLKYNTDSGMPAWNAPITFDADGAAWSEDDDAIEEMGGITGRF